MRKGKECRLADSGTVSGSCSLGHACLLCPGNMKLGMRLCRKRRTKNGKRNAYFQLRIRFYDNPAMPYEMFEDGNVCILFFFIQMKMILQ